MTSGKKKRLSMESITKLQDVGCVVSHCSGIAKVRQTLHVINPIHTQQMTVQT